MPSTLVQEHRSIDMRQARASASACGFGNWRGQPHHMGADCPVSDEGEGIHSELAHSSRIKPFSPVRTLSQSQTSDKTQ